MIPSVLALLGDNPMQSELSCHVCMNGNLFCRICYVQGADKSETVGIMNESGGGSNSAANANTADCDSDQSSVNSSSRGTTQKKQDTMAGLVSRAREFLKVYLFILSLALIINILF